MPLMNPYRRTHPRPLDHSRYDTMITIAVTCFIASVYFIATGGFDIGKWFFFASLVLAAMKVFP